MPDAPRSFVPPPLPVAAPLPAQRLCDSSALEEKGKAFVFDVLHYREPARAFALRFEGRVVAYLNRCVHVPTELDWTPGEFLERGQGVHPLLAAWRRLRAATRTMHRRALWPGRPDGDPRGGARRRRVVWLPTPATRPVEVAAPAAGA